MESRVPIFSRGAWPASRTETSRNGKAGTRHCDIALTLQRTPDSPTGMSHMLKAWRTAAKTEKSFIIVTRTLREWAIYVGARNVIRITRVCAVSAGDNPAQSHIPHLPGRVLRFCAVGHGT
jgi:hypothetical protein